MPQADIEKVKKLLKSTTAYQISKATGIGDTTISRWVTGKTKIEKMSLEHAIKLTNYYDEMKRKQKMIKWTGKDTSKRMTWEAEAETYKELAEKLNDRGLIPSLYDEQGQAWLETWYTTSDTEEAYEFMWATFIRDSQGMAYYQEIVEE